MVQINSELPIEMLGTKQDVNDYEFVLFHLFQSNKQYHNYFMNLRQAQPDRLMILDNSAYEFFIKGEELNMKDYITAICELKPQLYILPDVLMDMNKTIKGIREFLNNYIIYIPEGCEPLGVIQGDCINDFLWCLMLYKNNLNIENIAVPFHNRFLYELGKECKENIKKSFQNKYQSDITEDMYYAMGRVQFMKKFKSYFNDYKYIHMLGSHCPFEKYFYNQMKINSMDTGYPVKLGITGVELFKETSKPNIIIDDFLDKKLDENIKSLIESNVRKIKKI